jgi:quercetin dioxygenase-like cupin family protein
MNAFQVREVADRLARADEESSETLRTDAVSAEVMRFEPGDEDPMHAHAEDEIYHVHAGVAELEAGGEVTPVSAGDVIHLEPGTEHRFRDFEEELVMTVLYAPAKGSNE